MHSSHKKIHLNLSNNFPPNQSLKESTECFDFPTEIKSENNDENLNSIFIDIPMDSIKGRTHCFPREKKYINTTAYDPNDRVLDIGYQKLKILNMDQYPDFSLIKNLFIDHNELDTLPSGDHLPNLEYLNCSYNRLKTIPYYPKLKFLNVSNNSVTDLSVYNQSRLTYLDCSWNSNLVMNFKLDFCQHLYLENIGADFIDLGFYPKIEYLDCSNNKIEEIKGPGLNLIEIDISRNNLNLLPNFPLLQSINADHNLLTVIETYPKLVLLSIEHNRVEMISDQPLLTSLLASHNNIKSLGLMPKLRIVDINWNRIDHWHLPENIEYATICFNPISDINLSSNLLQNIKELRINYATYSNIYQRYLNNFQAIDTQTDIQRLEILLERMRNQLKISDSIIEYIRERFSKLKFRQKHNELKRIVGSIYKKIFGFGDIKSVHELQLDPNYIKLFKDLTDLYHQTLIITMYFNGYYN